MSDDVHSRFNTAFPWFDHERWAWSYDPVEHFKSHWYLISGSRAGAAGEIAIYMAGADCDQCEAVKRWLVREFNPKYDIPATHLLPRKLVGGHTHGSQLPPLGT